MLLQMFIDDKLVDQTILSNRAMHDDDLRKTYLQGAINHMLEKWDDLVKEENLKPRFVVKTML